MSQVGGKLRLAAPAASMAVAGATQRRSQEARLRACVESPPKRRVRARGLQNSTQTPLACRPGPLTGRLFKHSLSSDSNLVNESEVTL